MRLLDGFDGNPRHFFRDEPGPAFADTAVQTSNQYCTTRQKRTEVHAVQIHED